MSSQKPFSEKLQHKHINEDIAMDTYFAGNRSIEGHYYAQIFFGMTSKRFCVAGMKTESEFSDGYSDFIPQNRQNGKMGKMEYHQHFGTTNKSIVI
jgi:hypothetical protein